MLRALAAGRLARAKLLQRFGLGASLEDRQMTEKEPANLKSLEAKLKAAREQNQGPGAASGVSEGQTGMGYGSRLSVEIIASLLAGLGLGWVIDHFAGTGPLFMLVFMFAGLGIGIYNVIRMSRRQQDDENKQQ
jgi:ATP synthase protein I